MVHTLPSEKLSEDGGSLLTTTGSFPCNVCGRLFAQQQALVDHSISKHIGVYKDIKPDWYHASMGNGAGGGGSSVGELSSELTTCHICGFLFESVEECQHHVTDGIQPGRMLNLMKLQGGQVAVTQKPCSSTSAATQEKDRTDQTTGVNEDQTTGVNEVSRDQTTDPLVKQQEVPSSLRCPLCDRQCSDLRGWKQHYNYCFSANNNRTITINHAL